MNQILITQKLYVTPELKRKKKMYKVKFFLSVFLVCFLFSYYIYAEYDRNKNEEISQEILSNIDLSYIEEDDDTTVRIENNVLIVMLGEEEANNEEIDITKLAKDVEEYIQHNKEEQNMNTNNTTEENQEQQSSQQQEQQTYTTSNGINYTTDSIVNIPSLGINYPVLKTDETNMDEVLKISLVKFWGRKSK